MKINSYLRVWRLTATNALQIAFVNRGTNLFFLLGKAFRFLISLLFLFLIKESVSSVAGYSSDEMIVFFLTYQLIDSVAQTLFRNVYVFGNQVRSGELDFLLIKPLNPLFRILTDKPDINDLLFLIPTTLGSAYLLSTLSVTLTTSSLLLFGLLFLNAVIIALALHIIIVAMAISMVEIDGLVWLYRDLSALGRFPITIYHESVRLVLFFLLPIGLMLTIPAQVLQNLTPSVSLPIVFIVTMTLLAASLQFWKFSLKKYTSASS
ncbi:MAG: ABC-2 family transporter protein [bacterium]|nr:ABC-2 family transporter protein [bacterium]